MMASLVALFQTSTKLALVGGMLLDGYEVPPVPPRGRARGRRPHRQSGTGFRHPDTARLRGDRHARPHDAPRPHRPARTSYDLGPWRLPPLLYMARRRIGFVARRHHGDLGEAASRGGRHERGRPRRAARSECPRARSDRSGRDPRSADVGQRRLGRAPDVRRLSVGSAATRELTRGSVASRRRARERRCGRHQSVGGPDSGRL